MRICKRVKMTGVMNEHIFDTYLIVIWIGVSCYGQVQISVLYVGPMHILGRLILDFLKQQFHI